MDKYIGFGIDSKKTVACVVQKCKPITNRQRSLNPFAQNLRLLIKFKASILNPKLVEYFQIICTFLQESEVWCLRNFSNLTSVVTKQRHDVTVK